MPLRRDELTGEWILFAEARAERPQDFAPGGWSSRPGRCPFCRGHEADTPAAIAHYPAHAGQADWQVRVVPNKYPAVGGEESGAAEEICGGMQWPGAGRHEVIVESPEHVTSLTDLDDDTLRWTFTAYRDRMRALSDKRELRYAQLFKNNGPAAGASLEHLHSQLLALPLVPPRVECELAGSREFFLRHERCLLCDMVEREKRGGQRVVAESDSCLAWCAFAGRFPYEVWVAPRSHMPRFEQTADAVLHDAARLVRDVVAGLEACLPRPSYNYYLHTSPFDGLHDRWYHWHIEIVPRLARAAGFEWASGMAINSLLPEVAAAQLRAAR